MAVDVVSQVEIDRPRAVVSDYAVNPDNATTWYANIKSVEWKTPRPLRVGSQLAFVAHFLGRRLAYVYEVREWIEGERFVMSTADGPFPMQTTYTWADSPSGGTTMTLRNCGGPAGFAKVAAPMMGKSMARANRKDLQLLKATLESQP